MRQKCASSSTAGSAVKLCACAVSPTWHAWRRCWPSSPTCVVRRGRVHAWHRDQSADLMVTRGARRCAAALFIRHYHGINGPASHRCPQGSSSAVLRDSAGMPILIHAHSFSSWRGVTGLQGWPALLRATVVGSAEREAAAMWTAASTPPLPAPLARIDSARIALAKRVVRTRAPVRCECILHLLTALSCNVLTRMI